jgi:glycosyltransferase involved in cell wall biosynthesis
VATDDLVACYQVADVFLCMSEHEGYCVPVIEAFRFGVPVLAFEAGAVPETMDRGGILIREKRFAEIAELAYALVQDEELREKVVSRQDAVLNAMDSRDEEGLLMSYVEQLL